MLKDYDGSNGKYTFKILNRLWYIGQIVTVCIC